MNDWQSTYLVEVEENLQGGRIISTLTIRLPDTKHQRLKAFARARGVSLNKLVEEWATVALAQLDAENSYHIRAARGQPDKGLELLDKLDSKLKLRSRSKK
jgi:hypothetical protein